MSLTPNAAQTGSVTITAVSGGYEITNSLSEVNGGASVNGGAFVAATPATGTSLPIGFSSSVPEPASLTLLGASLAGIGLVRRRRRA